jgi:hypothetical protein
MSTITQFAAHVDVETQPQPFDTPLHRYVLTYKDGSTITSPFIYDTEDQAREYGDRAVIDDRRYATEIAENYDRLVSAGLIER